MKYVPYYPRWVTQFPQSDAAPREKRQEDLLEFTSSMACEDLEGQAERAVQLVLPLLHQVSGAHHCAAAQLAVPVQERSANFLHLTGVYGSASIFLRPV